MENRKQYKRENNREFKKYDPIALSIEIKGDDVIKEVELLRDLIPDIKDIIKSDGYSEYNDGIELTDCIQYLSYVNTDMIYEYSKDGYPSLYDRSCRRVKSINCAANRCTLKTDRFVTFGFKITYTYDRNAKEYTNISTVLDIILYKEIPNAVEGLLNNGWSKKEIRFNK